MYPVTAGGGGRGNYENSKIVQGTFVFGFFLDGDDAQQPVIMGCMGYNDYNKMYTTLSQQSSISNLLVVLQLKDRQYIGVRFKKKVVQNQAEGPGKDEGVGESDQQEDTDHHSDTTVPYH